MHVIVVMQINNALNIKDRRNVYQRVATRVIANSGFMDWIGYALVESVFMDNGEYRDEY